MDDREFIEGRIREFLADALDAPSHGIGLDQNLFEKAGLDSIGAVMIFVEISIEFGIPEPDDENELREVNTISKLIDFTIENREV